MKMRITQACAVVFLAAVLTMGCAGYGVLGPVVHPDTGPGLDDLLARWNDMSVSCVFDSGGRPVALLFDPKGDDRVLTANEGGRLKGPEEVLSVNGSIEKGMMGRPSRLVTVLGPDGSFYGYAYTPLYHLVLKAVDEKTLKAGAPILTDYRNLGP